MSLRDASKSEGTPAHLAAGEMRKLIASYPWASTALGPIETWPQSLRVAVRLLLNTRHPMFIWWGSSLIQLYNDAYRETMGSEQHPWALGAPGRETWAEIWDTIGPQIELVMTGQGATWHEDQLVPITRYGEQRDIYWTYSFSPIDDEGAPNGVGGVLVICRETTHEVMAQRSTEDRYRQLFGAMGEGFCVVEVLFDDTSKAVDYVFLETNPAFVAQTGLGDAVGKSMRSLRSNHEEHWFAAYGQVALTGQSQWIEYEAAALGRWYNVHAFRVGDAADHHVAILFNDVTERRNIEQRQREIEARFRAFVTASSDAVYRMSADWA